MSERVERVRRNNDCTDRPGTHMRVAQSCNYCKGMVREAGFVVGLVVLHVGCLGPYIVLLNGEIEAERAQTITLTRALAEANNRVPAWSGITQWYSTNNYMVTNNGLESTPSNANWVVTTSGGNQTITIRNATFTTGAGSSFPSLTYMNSGGPVTTWGNLNASESDLGP